MYSVQSESGLLLLGRGRGVLCFRLSGMELYPEWLDDSAGLRPSSPSSRTHEAQSSVVKSNNCCNSFVEESVNG
jgi:hypothetical protein